MGRAHKRQRPPLGVQGFRYVARPVQHTDHVNTVLVLQVEQEVIFKVLDGQHPDAVDKGYFRITGRPMPGMRDGYRR